MIFATLLLSFVTLSVVDAQPVPVTIERCTVTGGQVLQNPKLGYRPTPVEGITIDYVIGGTGSAGEIDFNVRYAGVTATLVDRGVLRAGVKTRREFSTFNAVYSGGDRAACTVRSVLFADGTRWDSPATSPSAQR